MNAERGLIIKADYEGNLEWIFHKIEGFKTYHSFVEIPQEDSIAVTGWIIVAPYIYRILWAKYGPIGSKGGGPGQGGTEKYYGSGQHNEGYSIIKTINYLGIPIYAIVGGIWYENVGGDHHQNCDAFLLQIDMQGNEYPGIFPFGDSYDDEIGYCVQKTLDGGFIVVGGKRPHNGASGWDVFLVKLTPSGTSIQWQKTYGGLKDDIGYSVQQTSDSGYVICGTSQSFSPDGKDEIYFLRIDKYGNKIFEKTFGKPQFYCYGSSIKLTSDGGYIIVGTERYSGDVPINKGDEIYCIKADPVHSPILQCYNPVVYDGLYIHWTDNSTNEVRFEIDRKIGATGVWTTIGNVPANAMGYCDTDFGSYYGQDVYYRARAVSEYNSSAPSNEIKVKIPGPGIFSDTLKAIDYYHSSRNLYRDNNGHYHLILKHHNRLWWTKSTNNGQTWSLAKSLAWTGSEIPSVVATSTGLPCFVWQEKTGTAPNFVYDLVYTYIDAQGNIHKTTLVDNAGHDLSPAMAITPDDQIYLAFIHTLASNGKITCLRFNFNNPQYAVYCEFTNCNYPAHIRVTTDDANYPHLVWDEYYFKNYGSQAKEVRRIYHGWSSGSGSAKEVVAEGWLSGAYRRIVSAPDIRCASNGIQVCWRLSIEGNPWVYEIYYRAKSGNNWGKAIEITQDPAIGNSPACGRIIGGKVLCLANNKIFVTYPGNPHKSAVLVENVNNYDAIPVPSGTVGGATGIVYSRNTDISELYKIIFTIKTIPYIPPYNPVVFSTPAERPPEFTAYNNSRRFLRDAQGRLHLAFTSNNQIYHTFLQDTTWSEPVLIGEGRYPALALGPEGRIYCLWAYNQGQPDFLEELRFSQFDGSHWSSPIGLLHTYNSFFWGIGAPSLTIKDTLAYFCYKSYFGPTYHPAPGGQMPMVIILESRHLVYGKFSINNPAGISRTSIDTITITPTPYDPLVYQDSLVPLLISPSITVDLTNVPHILWEGDSTNMRYYTITNSGITKQLFDNGVDFPFISMNGDQIQLFYTARDSIRYRYGWTGTTNLSQIQTIASCESPISSGQYLTWTKRESATLPPSSVADGGLSHLYYGSIPASGPINPIEVNYSTDLISHPQILFNSKPPSLDLVWTEYSEIDSLGYIYYLNLPLTDVAPKYAFDMGTETPVPILIQRDGYKNLGPEDYKTFDYDSTELIYHLTLHSPHTKYKIRWTYYHEEPQKLKLQFNIDEILHRNRWVNPGEKAVEEAWIPDACLQDNEITIKVKKLSGTIAVLSGIEIETEDVGGGGPQGKEAQILRPFFFEKIHPNPTKGMIRIRFNSPDKRRVSVKIYDVAGRLASTVFEGKARIGMNEFLIRPKDFASGVYFVRLETEGYTKTEKVILLK